MLREEILYDVHKMFTHIVNHILTLGKKLDREELNIKIKSLWTKLIA